MINMEAIPKFDIKSDIKFDISIKPITWIGQQALSFLLCCTGKTIFGLPCASGAGPAKEDATIKTEKNRATTCCMIARF